MQGPESTIPHFECVHIPGDEVERLVSSFEDAYDSQPAALILFGQLEVFPGVPYVVPGANFLDALNGDCSKIQNMPRRIQRVNSLIFCTFDIHTIWPKSASSRNQQSFCFFAETFVIGVPLRSLWSVLMSPGTDAGAC